MAKFKVGDRVRIKDDDGVFSSERDELGEMVIKRSMGSNWFVMENISRNFPADDLELVESDATGLQECPTIIKVSQTFTLQIKDITIDLSKSEIDELIKQLNEVY